MSRIIYIQAQNHSDGGKAKVVRPKAKWTSCTMGKGWAALRAAAKEFGCKETEIVLDPNHRIEANLYTATRKEASA